MAQTNNSSHPADEELVLYQFYSSYYSQMVRLACVEKGIPFRKVEIDLMKGDNYRPEYLRINPACEVPALTHRGKTIAGSEAIINYLDQISPREKSALATNPEVEEFRRQCNALPIAEITLGWVRHPELFEGAKVPEKTKENFSKRVNRRTVLEENIVKYPDLADAYREKLSRVIDTEQQVANIQTVYQLLRQLESFLDQVDAQLRTRAAAEQNQLTSGGSYDGWLFGQDFTNADIALATLLARLDVLGLAGRFWDLTERLYLADYYRRLKMRPSFKQECVHHLSDN